MAVLSDDMGGITAYAAAVNRGYTGTKEEFEQLMYSYTEVAERAEAAAGNAHESEEATIEAKDIAVSAKNEAVSARDAAQSARDASVSAKNDSESARDASISAKNDTLAAKDAVMSAKGSVDETSANFSDVVTAAISDVNAAGRNQKELAKTHAIDSEAWAVGQREGADVGVSDETYHNNSKYYAEQSALAKGETETARDTAITAKDNAVAAKNEAETAKGQAQDIVDGINAKSEQIDQNAEDITALQTAMETKAEIDGSYEDLVSGGAYQIISNMEEVDNTPYGYRTAGGSLEIGDREKLKKIVGGSLFLNQLIRKHDDYTFEVGNGGGLVITIDADGYINITGTASERSLIALKPYPTSIEANHVAVLLCDGYSGFQWGRSGFGYITRPCFINKHDVRFSAGARINIAEGDVCNIHARFMAFDLTLMLGSTIADYVYTLETATAGAGVAWLKAHFPKIFNSGYIPYNAGTLEHVSGLSAHKMVGFNLLNPALSNRKVGRAYAYAELPIGKTEVLQMELIDKDTSVNISGYAIGFVSTDYDINSNTALQADDFRWCYTNGTLLSKRKNYSGGQSSAYGNKLLNRLLVYPNTEAAWTKIFQRFDISVHLVWDGERDGEYEPYEEHSYPIDSDVTLRGIPKLDANNNLYYDGDEYEADGTVTRKYGIVDLGTLSWAYNSTTEQFRAGISPAPAEGFGSIVFNAICTKYHIVPYNSLTDKTASVFYASVNGINIKDTSYTDAATFKAAMSGVMLVYELATPTTESADPYTEIQNVSNWGTEEFVTTSLVPVGHETAYQPDLRAKVEVAPESPDTDGYYLMKRENGQNSYVAYLGELPSDPTTDGTYTLKCTVASGTATKTWEADE